MAVSHLAPIMEMVKMRIQHQRAKPDLRAARPSNPFATAQRGYQGDSRGLKFLFRFLLCSLSRLWRLVTWPIRSRWRLLCSAWLVGFFWIGQASVAMAGDDGPIVGPNLGSAGGQTVFEQYGPQKFALYLQLSDSNHGAPYVSQTMWEILRSIESALTYMVFLLARGAITSMEWLLNLRIYSDNSAAIDAAVRAVAAQVFWPLFGATLAIGAFSAYARMKREGGGSLFNDASWLVAASIFAVAFVSGPSAVMGELDNLRTDLASAAMTGYSSYAPAGVSAAGFPASNLPADQAGATRKLADAMWNVYVVAPWCYVNFDSMSECSDLGKDYIQGDARWQHEVDWMCGTDASCNDVGGNSDDKSPPYCPPELNADCDWIRGPEFRPSGRGVVRHHRRHPTWSRCFWCWCCTGSWRSWGSSCCCYWGVLRPRLDDPRAGCGRWASGGSRKSWARCCSRSSSPRSSGRSWSSTRC